MSEGEVVKSGYLTKSPPEGRVALAQWHRRWFVFADSHLVYPLAERYVRMEYYQSEEDAAKLKNPKGVIKLQTCSKVTNRENMRGFKHVFDVCTSERTYHLVADSSQEKHDWINTLNTTLFTPSRAHKHSSPSPPQHSTAHDPSSQHHPNIRPVGLQPPNRRSPDSSSTEHVQRPLSVAGDLSASRQNSRPLPPVPGHTAASRPLPPTPPDRASTPTHYKRLSDGLQNQTSLTPSSQVKRNLVRQTKSSSAIQEGPDCYQLSSLRASVNQDYENLEAKPLHGSSSTASPLPHSSRDYVNLEDQDYEDTATTGECVYEDYVPRPGAAPICLPPQAPISGRHGKGGGGGSGGVGYMNVESSATISDDYSLLEAAPLQSSPPSSDYSVLEAVHPQPTSSRVDDYSRLELTGHLDLGPPKKPSPYKRPTNKDYENLAHVAHPDNGDYSNLQY